MCKIYRPCRQSALYDATLQHNTCYVFDQCTDVTYGTGERLKYRNQCLLRAAQTGSVDEILRITEERVFIDTTGPYRNSVLHLSKEYAPAMHLLVSLKANVNARNIHSQTPLHAVATARSSACIDVLIDHGADVDAQSNSGHSPLHWAIINSNLTNALHLIDRGASTTVINVCLAMQSLHHRHIHSLDDANNRVVATPTHQGCEQDTVAVLSNDKDEAGARSTQYVF
jgi:ankyrin repeat protein